MSMAPIMAGTTTPFLGCWVGSDQMMKEPRALQRLLKAPAQAAHSIRYARERDAAVAEHDAGSGRPVDREHGEVLHGDLALCDCGDDVVDAHGRVQRERREVQSGRGRNDLEPGGEVPSEQAPDPFVAR